jgi:glyoxylase-like metal-dependent hydrolase (beta-lactamase superfamily II)
MKLATNLHRIGSDYVNSYLVVATTGITVVDTGIPGNWKDLVTELEGMRRSLDDIRGVILTHGDTDHIGFAERLRRDHGVPIYVHEEDAARARGQVKKPAPRESFKVGPLLSFLWYGAWRGGLRIAPVTEVVTFADGAMLDLPGSPRIISVPGHTPGSVAIHVAAVDALFVGDAMTTKHVLTGVQGPGPAPFTLDPEMARASLARLEDVSASWVLPGHGAPWNGGVAESLRRFRAAIGASDRQQANR